MHKGDLIELDRDSTVTQKDILKKLKDILSHHEGVVSGGKITDNNILNIYNDEISIIKSVLH